MSDILATFVDYLVTALSFAIFGRVIMSWVSPAGRDPISMILIQITDVGEVIVTVGVFLEVRPVPYGVHAPLLS